MRIKKLLVVTFTLVFLGMCALTIVNSQRIFDWARLRNYEPSADIARLSVNSSMSDEGRRLFYLHDPELLNKESFFGKCSISEVTIVLGCYITHTKIYIFDVDDERLEGVEEVTAAHEMLHAAWDRLSVSEKNRLTETLTTVYESSTDERLLRTVESYRERDPSVVPNELHSIIGTEVRDIPEELETYYSRYFLDRLDVVTQAENYAQEFVQREQQIKEYDSQLEELRVQIELKETDIELLNEALSVERNQLEAKRGNPQEFNAGVPAYNQNVQNFNNLVQSLRADIERFNQIVQERNTIALEEQALVKAIDTRLIETE